MFCKSLLCKVTKTKLNFPQRIDLSYIGKLHGKKGKERQNCCEKRKQNKFWQTTTNVFKNQGKSKYAFIALEIVNKYSRV